MVDILPSKPGGLLIIPASSEERLLYVKLLNQLLQHANHQSRWYERIYEDDQHVIELVVPLLTDTDGKVGSMFVKVVWRAGGRSKTG